MLKLHKWTPPINLVFVLIKTINKKESSKLKIIIANTVMELYT